MKPTLPEEEVRMIRLQCKGCAGNVSLSGYTLRQDARRFELYEKSRALTLGLGKAVEYALGIGLERIWPRIESLGALLRQKLAEIPEVVIRDSGGA